MPAPLIYRQYGGSLQVDIPHFAALVEAIHIPETQWMATACPVEGLHCDKRFLSFLDADGNGRIRVAELREAVKHTARLLQSHKGVDARSDVLELDALSAEGAKIRAAARRILETLKAPDTARISLEQVRTSEKVLRDAGVNGQGIVAPTFLPEKVRGLASRIMAAFPEVKDRSGAAGIDIPTLQRFREESKVLLAHLGQKEAVHVWGASSLERAQRIRAVKPLLDGYFLQCRLVAAQPEAAANLKLPAGRVEGVLGDAAALEKAAAVLPIAPLEPSGVLTWSRLYRGPAVETLEAFRKEVAAPITGDAERLSDSAWKELSAKADAVLAWQAGLEAHPLRGMAAELPSLSTEEVDTLEKACLADLALREELDAITELERLILYQRWLLTFANNFISMPDLYTASKRALFEQGTLILGGRKYTLSVLAKPRDAHAALTSQGTTCILYVLVTPKDGGEGFEVAVPVTRGRSTNLEVGKRGIFHDVEGKEYDARVTHVIRHPVSLWEAMTSPFQRISSFISSKMEAFAASGDKLFGEQLEKGFAATSAKVAAAGTAPAPAPAPAPAAGGGLAGAVAAGGIALAALGSSLAFIVSQAKSLTLADVVSAAIIITAVVMLPAGLFGWLKLRRRNLALLLEGSGWALNDRLKLTRELASLVTRKPRLPKGATVDRTDVMRATFSHTQHEEGEEEEEAIPGGVKFLVVLAILLALLWQVRGPLVRFACGHAWLSTQTCGALLPAASASSAEPATPTAPPPAPTAP